MPEPAYTEQVPFSGSNKRQPPAAIQMAEAPDREGRMSTNHPGYVGQQDLMGFVLSEFRKKFVLTGQMQIGATIDQLEMFYKNLFANRHVHQTITLDRNFAVQLDDGTTFSVLPHDLPQDMTQAKAGVEAIT